MKRFRFQTCTCRACYAVPCSHENHAYALRISMEPTALTFGPILKDRMRPTDNPQESRRGATDSEASGLHREDGQYW